MSQGHLLGCEPCATQTSVMMWGTELQCGGGVGQRPRPDRGFSVAQVGVWKVTHAPYLTPLLRPQLTGDPRPFALTHLPY